MFVISFINRRSLNNIILAGLWFSDEKPPMSTFLQPVVEILLPLESDGGLCILQNCLFALGHNF